MTGTWFYVKVVCFSYCKNVFVKNIKYLLKFHENTKITIE